MTMKSWIVVGLMLFHWSGIAWSTGNEEENPVNDDGCYETKSAPRNSYAQSPLLDKLEASGDLPPITDRLPTSPLAIEPVESDGRYCEELSVIADKDDTRQVMSSPYRANFPLRVEPSGALTADVISSYDVDTDRSEITLHLREGMKWSDGSEFTSQDFVLRYEIEKTNPGLDLQWRRMPAGIASIEARGPFSVEITFDAPFQNFPLYLTTWRGGESVLYVPSQWLMQWYDNAAAAKEAGYADWSEPLALCCRDSHLRRPTLQPWFLSEYTADKLRSWQRNPYYHVVDSIGQQLPYFDRVVSTVVANREVYHTRVLSGDVDIAYVADHEAYVPYLSTLSGESDSLSVKQIQGVHGSEAAYTFNFDHPDDRRRDLFRDREFRRALSLAINRDEINDKVYFGLAVARQATVVSQASYYQSDWGHASEWIEYDPDAARRMLDELGLSVDDSDGFRRFDGSPEPFTLTIGHGRHRGTGNSVSELVTNDWKEIGLRVQLVEYSSDDFGDPVSTAKYDAHFLSQPLVGMEIYDAIADDGGLLGIQTSDDTDFDAIVALKRAIAERRSSGYNTYAYRNTSLKIYDLHATSGFTIGTVGMAPILVVTRSALGNIPDRIPPWASGHLALDYFGAQWFRK